MFAVLKTGGKQYRVQSGDVLRVEKLAADAGDTVQFNDILMIGGTIGTPLVADAGVQAEVIEQVKGEKVIHYVKRRRKHSSQRTKGHRQQLTLLRVTDLLETGAGKAQVKAAVGAGGVASSVEPEGRYAKNKTDQAEMNRRVATGEAPEKVAEAASGIAASEPTGSETIRASKPEADRPEAETSGAETVKVEKPKAKAAPGAEADDLKKLSGVGPALEKKLHAAGVSTFAQIAGWSEADVARFDGELDFKGRITREGWVAQAGTLEAEKE